MAQGKQHPVCAASAPAVPAPASGTPLTGQTRYEKVGDLNKGAHGVVQLCKDKVTGEYVAVKFIGRGDKVTQYVEREIINHRSLNHPHVVQFKEVFLTPHHLAIAMEFAAGGDLFEYLKSRGGKLPEVHARWFFQQLMVALDYCHRMGVSNRDIKLENTLLDHNSPPLLKLCDFGYSKNAATQSAPRSLVGTPAYLAPEVIGSIKGKSYSGEAADVWSSGVMLYVMLVGHYPFERMDDKQKPKNALTEMYKRIQVADYHLPSQLQLSDGCKDLLRQILQPDPRLRTTIRQIFQHPWFLQSLPAGVLSMNDQPDPAPEGLQSEESIRQIVREARGTAAQQQQQQQSQATPGTAPVHSGRDYLDDLVDDALMNPDT